MARAAVALGADGVMIEVHPQRIVPCRTAPVPDARVFAELMTSLRAIAAVVGLKI